MGEKKKGKEKRRLVKRRGTEKEKQKEKMGEEERCFQNLPRGPRGTQGFS